MDAEREQHEDVPRDRQPDTFYGDLRKRNERLRKGSRQLETQRQRRIDLIIEASRKRRPSNG